MSEDKLFPIIKFKESSTLRTYFENSGPGEVGGFNEFLVHLRRRCHLASFAGLCVAGRFLFFSDASEIAAEHSAGMSHMLHKKLVAKKEMRKKTKENKEELKLGIIIMYVVKKKERRYEWVPKVRHKFGPNGISAFFIPFLFLKKFARITLPLKNVCFS